MMDVDCLFSPVNHISIAQLDKICLSGGVEVVTDKWGDADNIFILRSIQKWLKYTRCFTRTDGKYHNTAVQLGLI